MKSGLNGEVNRTSFMGAICGGNEVLHRYMTLFFGIGVVLSTVRPVNADDLESYLVRAKQVLVDRERISTLSCQYRVNRKNLGYVINGYYAIDGDKFRRDLNKVLHAGAPKEQVEFFRRIAIVGSEVREVDSISGASVDFPEEFRLEFPDYRFAGLTTRPINTWSKIKFDGTILATFVADHGAEWNESEQRIADIPVIAISKVKDERTESIYFGRDGRYCGCGVHANGSLYYVIQVESMGYSRTGFPIEIIRGEVSTAGEVEEEFVEFSDLKLNEHVNEEVFQFTGLGLKAGDKVRVRARNEEGRLEITDCEWDGVQVVGRSKGPN